MAASEKVDLEMPRISDKLNEHFAFLNANGAAPDGTKISEDWNERWLPT